MSIFDYNHLTRISSDIQYDQKTIKRCIILVRNSRDSRKVGNAKLELFSMLSHVVVKNIENFFHLTRGFPNILHNRNDLVGEAFMIMDKCLEKFDFKREKQFYFYYNKSLTRGFVRIIEKNYYRSKDDVRVFDDYESLVFVGEVRNSFTLVEFYCDLFQLTELEKKILKSKLEDQKPSDFLLENDDVSWNKYSKSLDSIKEKMEPLNKEK